jgi:phosphohistidine phosphatase
LTRQLILLRHAQALPATQDQGDAQRGLTETGIAQCAALAKRLAGVKLGAVLTSPAVRTSETARLGAGDRATPEPRPELYDATADRLAEVIRALPDDCSHAMIVAHNPGISVLAHRLGGEAIDEMGTACAISFLVDGDWRDLLDDICWLDWRFDP